MFLFFGGIITIIGILWLFDNLGILPINFSQVLWPSLLIFLGVYIILLPSQIRSSWKDFWFKKK